jgi:hypothetical protein
MRNPFRRRLRLRDSAWMPLTRVDLGGRPVGLVWREGGLWYSAPWDDTGATRHLSREGALRCLMARKGLEGANVG